MMKSIIRHFIIVMYCIAGLQTLQAQKLQEKISAVDSASLFVYTQFEFAYNIPLADLRKDYKNFLSVGTGINVKTKSNWLIGFTFNYQFEGKVQPEVTNAAFKELVPEGAGYFIANNGTATNDISVDYRGLQFTLMAGKVFCFTPKYRNSGMVLKAGIGVLQHYMHINNPNNAVLSLNEEYRKGYDRLTLGFSLYQFIGYQHLTKKNLLCFYGGIEIVENWAKRQRAYDFSLMAKDNNKYFESIIGFKVGWIIPLYKHNPYRVFQSRF